MRDAMRCDAMRCGAMRCDAVRCGAMRCDAVRCGAMRCDAMRCGAVRCGAVRCGAVRCGAMRCAANWVWIAQSRPFRGLSNVWDTHESGCLPYGASFATPFASAFTNCPLIL